MPPHLMKRPAPARCLPIHSGRGYTEPAMPSPAAPRVAEARPGHAAPRPPSVPNPCSRAAPAPGPAPATVSPPPPRAAAASSFGGGAQGSRRSMEMGGGASAAAASAFFFGGPLRSPCSRSACCVVAGRRGAARARVAELSEGSGLWPAGGGRFTARQLVASAHLLLAALRTRGLRGVTQPRAPSPGAAPARAPRPAAAAAYAARSRGRPPRAARALPNGRPQYAPALRARLRRAPRACALQGLGTRAPRATPHGRPPRGAPGGPRGRRLAVSMRRRAAEVGNVCEELTL